jgi:tetratricopeptide (TPR) repeat protein
VAAEARDRYPSAAALAADLRRHLTHRPLCGVANRSLAERWQKWRRRRPTALRLAVLVLAVLGISLALAGFALSHLRERAAEAEYALREGRRWQEGRHYAEAVATLQHGLQLAEGLPDSRSLAEELRQQLGAALRAREAERREELIQELRLLADDLRVLYGEEAPATAPLRGVEARCRDVWEQHALIRETLGLEQHAGMDADLLDIAILWADLHVRSAPAGAGGVRREEALRVLAEAEALFGTSAVLEHERLRHRKALGVPECAGPAAGTSAPPAPRTAWEHYALGRSFLAEGNLQRAEAELDCATQLEPYGLWPNYYRGLCAYRLRQYGSAAEAFSVCVGAAPGRAPCYYHRALAYTALGRLDRARSDYDRALQLEPTLAAALLNRGMLHYRAKRYDAALADLRQALERGADPGMVHYNLALVHLARQDRGAALSSLDRALEHDPQNEDARRLRDTVRDQR